MSESAELPIGTLRDEAHAYAELRGAKCSECPLNQCGRGPVFGTIMADSELIAIGEAPGDNEVEEGVPFVGKTGRVLHNALARGGLTPFDYSVTNTLLCQPPEGLSEYLQRLSRAHRRKHRAWKKRRAAAKERREVFDEEEPQLITPLDCCAPRLKRDLDEANASVLLAVGSAALKKLADVLGVPFGKAKMEKGTVRVLNLKDQHGHPLQLDDGRILMSSYHPAYAMRTAKSYMRVIEDDITRAAWVAVRGEFDWREPEFILNPSVEEIINVMDVFLQSGARVTYDLETDGVATWKCNITCIGMGAEVDGREVIIVVPIRHAGAKGQPAGDRWWSPEDMKRVGLAVREVMETNELAGHNVVAFDSAVCLRTGLIRDRKKTYTDTMALHHDTWANDLPHDLGFVTGRFLECPNWKKDADAKYVDDVSDAELHLYCAKDVLTTMRCIEPLERLVRKCGTQPQYETDKKLALICRDMTELGFPVSERIRRIMSKQLNAKCNELLTKFKAIAGEYDSKYADLNPRSVYQLRDWLFDYKGLVPTLTTSSDPWEEGLPWDADTSDEDPSTSAQSLVKLLAQGVDKHTDRFINTLLEYRAHDKLRGTYIDNLRCEQVDWSRWGAEYASMTGNYSLVHANWISTRVPTGRLACRGPNIQNLPTRGRMNIKRMYYAPKGHVLVGADMDQLELRIYAWVSGDKILWDAITQGLDPHAMNAATMFARGPSEVQQWYDNIVTWKKSPDGELQKKAKQMRNIAKRFAFLECYGGEDDKLYETMSTDRNPSTGQLMFPGLQLDRVLEWHENWHKTHPETRAWHNKCWSFMRQHGYIAAPWFDKRRRFGPLDKKNAIPNMQIQGGAGSMMNQMMIRIAERIPHRGWSPLSGPISQVHDEFLVCVPKDRAEEAKKIVEEEMNFEYEGMKYTAEAGISRSWARQ